MKKNALEFTITSTNPTTDTYTASLWSTTASGELDTK